MDIILELLLKLIKKASCYPNIDQQALLKIEKNCRKIQLQLKNDLIQVAVAGTIKSGKSSLINALLKKDYLKRGAGVTTSIVTRIRRGPALKAYLTFKSCHQINAEINQAMLMPDSESPDIDIQKPEAQAILADFLETCPPAMQLDGEGRNLNTTILSSYLKGFPAASMLKQTAAHEHYLQTLSGEQFEQQRDFAGSDHLAIYLKDILVEIDTESIDSKVELADCQGSDSPNPRHLLMIQEYLNTTHLVIYVISSRTGLRQADFKFLTIIKKMGILDNIIFVLNIDFSEHSDLEDIKTLGARVRAELALFQSEPEVYFLSGLFNLFTQTRQDLNPKDQLRLSQWEQDQDLAAFSNQQTRAFKKAFNQKLNQERHHLLTLNYTGRIHSALTQIKQWIAFHKKMPDSDARKINMIIKDIKAHQDRTEQLKFLVEDTLTGSLKKLKQELNHEINRFFDTRSKIYQALKSFITAYGTKADLEKGFSTILQSSFQDFKTAVDGFTVENINPEIINLIRQLETKIHNHFQGVMQPFNTVITEALDQYNRSMANLGLPMNDDDATYRQVDLKSVKTATIKFSPLMARIRFQARTKTISFMHLGGGQFIKLFKKITQKPVEPREAERAALRSAVKSYQKETIKSLKFLFKDFQENLKYQYFFKLADAMVNEFKQVLQERFEICFTDMDGLTQISHSRRIDQEVETAKFKELEEQVEEITELFKTATLVVSE